MANLVLSVMKQENADVDSLLQPVLDQFQKETGITVKLKILDWSDGQEVLLRTVLYGDELNVSEVGTSWVSSFLGMNGLQPFTDRDIRMIGSPNDFLDVVWESGKPPGRNRLWAIPWVAGTRVLFYRKDILAQAGIDPKSAFGDQQQLEQTLANLKSQGVSAPWIVPTQTSLNSLFYTASWIWDAGGDFIDEENLQILFNTEESVAGLVDYFNLGRFLHQPADQLDDAAVEKLFWQDGEAAVTIGGHWLLHSESEISSSQVIDNLGVAPLPGIPFVGGSNLVIWEQTRNKDQAIQLISFLSRPSVQKTFSQGIGLLPVRHDVLADPELSQDPVFEVASAGIKNGRTFPTSSMWGIIERRLTIALSEIWQEWLSSPEANLEDIIAKNLDPLARRLDIMMRSR